MRDETGKELQDNEIQFVAVDDDETVIGVGRNMEHMEAVLRDAVEQTVMDEDSVVRVFKICGKVSVSRHIDVKVNYDMVLP